MKTWMAVIAVCVGCSSVDEVANDGAAATPKEGWRRATVRTPIRGEDISFTHTLAHKPRALRTGPAPAATSGHAIAVDASRILVLDEENGDLVILDRQTAAVRHRVPLGARPDRLVLADDGTAFASLRGAGEVVAVDPEGQVRHRVHLGAGPRGLALSADGKELWVILGEEGSLVRLSPSDLTEIVRVTREDLFGAEVIAITDTSIVAAGRSDRGISLYRSTLTSVGAGVSVSEELLRIDTPFDGDLRPMRQFDVRSNRVRGVALQPESGQLLLVHHQAIPGPQSGIGADFPFKEPPPDFEGGESQGESESASGEEVPMGYGGGGMGAADPRLVRPVEVAVTALGAHPTFAVAVHDPLTRLPMTMSVAQASDIAHSPTHALALVTGFGSDSVLVLDTSQGDPMASPIAVFDVGQAPRGVAFSPDGRFAYTADAHSFTVSEIDLSSILDAPPLTAIPAENGQLKYAAPCSPSAGPGCEVGERIEPTRQPASRQATFGTDPLPALEREGRRIFTFVGTPGLTTREQLACASCHIEGGEDGLVWAVEEGQRQTPALAGRLADTAPFNWSGSQPSLESNMVQTVERMAGQGLSRHQRDAVSAYLGTLEPIENPYTHDEESSEAVERGRMVFTDPLVGCASCHAGPATTDGKAHSVGTGEFACSSECETKFNTPSLQGVFATAPYFHDGRALTLEDALQQTANSMGNTAQLEYDEIQDLIRYLQTL